MAERTEHFSAADAEAPDELAGSAAAPKGGASKWREQFRDSGHPLAECLGHLVALKAVIEARPPEGVQYLFSRSTLGFLEQAAGYAAVLPIAVGKGHLRVLDLDAALVELRNRTAGGDSGSYSFGRVLAQFGSGLGPVETLARDKVDPGETALGPGVVEALALAAWLAAGDSGDLAPVRLDDFVFGLLAVAGAEAFSLGRALGPAPSVSQASALRSEIPSRLSDLASAIDRPRAIDFASTVPAGWAPPPEAEETPDYRPDRPIRLLGHDLLGFGEDARAIAELLCLSKAGARAVGVFGDWGSGKSSLLNLVEQQIVALLGRTPAANVETSGAGPFIRRAEHVRFNVWQYNDSELMLALADVTLRRLRRFGAIDKLRQRFETDRADWETEKAHGEGAIAAAEGRHRDAIARIQSAEDAAMVERAAASDSARREIAGLLRQGGAGATAATELLGLAESGKALFSTLSLAKMRYLLAANGVYWLAALLLAGLCAFGMWWATDGEGPLAPVVAGLLGFAAPFAKFLASLNETLMGYARAVDGAERAHATEIADARHESDAALRDIAAQTRKVEAAVAKIETYAGEGAAPLWRYLLHDSPEAREIEKARGVTSRVQDVFESIDQLIGAERDGDATDADTLPDRVIFYIDELDRCRADQVVRMLEAIHLLLAFDNFAVIVAVDSRWLVASLKSVFREELARSDPSDGGDPGEITVHEYIEKIIQVPVQVRPLAFDEQAGVGPVGTFVSLIDSLTEGSVQPEVERTNGVGSGQSGARLRIEPLPVEPKDVLQRNTLRAAAERARFTDQEVAGLRRLGAFVGRSPRTAKRFVNVYRLVRALQTGEAFERFRDGGFHAVQLCLAIQCGMGAADVARVRNWLDADGPGERLELEALLAALGPGRARSGAALIAEQIGSAEGHAAMRRAWAVTARFTFWSGADARRSPRASP